MKVTMSLWFPWRDHHRPPFLYPVSVPVRTVVFEPLFRHSARSPYVDPLDPNFAATIRELRPAALAGNLDTLLSVQRELDFLPTHAVVVFTGEGQPCLSDQDRDTVWDAYRVPVFEQVITATGRLVAWECEAHDGLHLAEDAQTSTRDVVETGICPCGVRSARAINLVTAPTLLAGSDRPMRFLPTPIVSAPRQIAM